MQADEPGLTPAEQLRDLLRNALIESGLTQGQLETRSGLKHTTVWKAMNRTDWLPTERTLAALAKVKELHLDLQVLLALRRTMLQPQPPDSVAGPGVPIGACDPLDLEVHPAGNRSGRDAAMRMPAYVVRAHDGELAAVVAQAAAGCSAMAVLVGSSSTGKTRACWEAVEPLGKQGWRLWHPFYPTRADAALTGLGAVEPRTVVWLNELQHYLAVGESMAAALHALLTDQRRAPVLVLGTLWSEYADAYAARPAVGAPDPDARTRELLATRRIDVPEGFDTAALERAHELAESGDLLLADVLSRGHDGRVAQHLAGAPELLARYATASPGAKALMNAAADARRLGVGLYLPLAFLAEAAPGYLHVDAYDSLNEDWLDKALADLGRPVHGDLAPLRLIRERPDYRPPSAAADALSSPAPTGPLFRLADYLEQHGQRQRRMLCPPASFWYAAHAHLTDPRDLRALALAANMRHRLQWAKALYQRAADAGDNRARTALTEFDQMRSWRVAQEAGPPSPRAIAAANDRDSRMRAVLAEIEKRDAPTWRAAAAGDARALIELAAIKEQDGHRDGALCLRRAATDEPSALAEVARMRRAVEDWERAKAFYQRAIAAGDEHALTELAAMRVRNGNRKGAEELYQRAAEAGNTHGLNGLASIKRWAGDREGAEELYLRAAAAGNTDALIELGWMRRLDGDRLGAEAFFQQAVDAGNGRALMVLGGTRRLDGDLEGATAAFQRAADAGAALALIDLAQVRERTGDRNGAKNIRLYGLDPDGTPAAPWS